MSISLGAPPLAGNRSHEMPGEHDMALIPGGTFPMGSDRHYPEEAPVHRVTVGRLWIDRTADWFSGRHEADAKACCIPENPRGGPQAGSYDRCGSPARIPRKVVSMSTNRWLPKGDYCFWEQAVLPSTCCRLRRRHPRRSGRISSC